jgi:hypothetical protein
MQIGNPTKKLKSEVHSMTNKTVTPALGEDSFTCPHCGAISHQTWFSSFLKVYEKEEKPWVPTPAMIEQMKQDQNLPRGEQKDHVIKFLERKLSKALFWDLVDNGHFLRTTLVNLNISRCYSCNEFAVWVADRLIYPETPTSIRPNEEMPDDVRLDFCEATAIVDKSPRGAAALLRLGIQKLMPHLGLKGKNVNDDIAELVKRGLDVRIQQALDVVRVVGNNAVHPGQIDLQDDKATAIKLFGLVNLIVEAMIATPKRIEKMYGELPPTALEAIKKRD